MYTVNVDKECGCFSRSGLQNNASFSSNDDALMNANSMVKQMNENFCGKHNFSLKEDGKTFQISMIAPEPSGGCCGGGHCS